MYTCTVLHSSIQHFLKKSQPTQLNFSQLNSLSSSKSSLTSGLQDSLKAQREMQARSTPSFACQRKGCVSNFEDECDCGHQPPNVGMNLEMWAWTFKCGHEKCQRHHFNGFDYHCECSHKYIRVRYAARTCVSTHVDMLTCTHTLVLTHVSAYSFMHTYTHVLTHVRT